MSAIKSEPEITRAAAHGRNWPGADILFGASLLPSTHTTKWLIDCLHEQIHTAIIKVAAFTGDLSPLWRLFD